MTSALQAGVRRRSPRGSTRMHAQLQSAERESTGEACFVTQCDRRGLAAHLGPALARVHELGHQPFYIPAYDRVKAGLLTIGVLARFPAEEASKRT